METHDPTEVIREGLGDYPLTPVIAEAIKFILNNGYESMVVVNHRGEIEFIDKLTEKLFNLSHGESKGKKVKEVLPHSELPEVLATGKPHIGRVLKRRDRPGSIVSRFPLVNNGESVGAFGRVILYSLEELERVREEARRYKEDLLNAEKKIKTEYEATYTFDHILGVSDKIAEQKELAKRMARTHGDVLIQGESGTGKELFAQAIHNEGKQRFDPFVRINCPAIPLEIAESELFGYEKGAFTGAKQEGKPGKFELAEGGTVFLDEIGALPLSIQAKLLRVIQERETERLGSKKPLKLNFRLITATNVDLRKLAEEGKFRFDLFFRLSKAVLTIPPLRERPEDIPIYVFHFLKILNKSFGTQIKAISKEALDTFARYSWPGNVRELSNVLEQSFYNMGAADIITASHLPKQFENSIHSFRQLQETERPLREIVGDIERDNILTALKRFSGNKRETARHLGIQRSTLYLRLKKYGLK